MSNALFHCEIEYKNSPHLMQIYTGFFKLRKLGIIDLKIRNLNHNSNNVPIINVLVNKKIKAVYDTQDGMTWIPGDWEENIRFFRENFKNINYYFKRSFHKQLMEGSTHDCKVYPLGFNYNIQPRENLLQLTKGLNNKTKFLIKSKSLLRKVFNKNFFYTEDFEYFPVKNKTNKILFLTRVWDPNTTSLDCNKEHRKKINEVRVACIEACQQHYGKSFTGGLLMNDYSSKKYKAYAVPFNLTNKKSFLDAIKDHTICISTSGLHNSIGWKFGEYVAASRAIVSEPLAFELPGDFEVNKNYFQFENVEQLLGKIDFLLQNQEIIYQTMLNNFHYYNVYLKPENLILNTLLTIANNE